jgi:hypothetical protein
VVQGFAFSGTYNPIILQQMGFRFTRIAAVDLALSGTGDSIVSMFTVMATFNEFSTA